jgi:Alpha-kinase family
MVNYPVSFNDADGIQEPEGDSRCKDETDSEDEGDFAFSINEDGDKSYQHEHCPPKRRVKTTHEVVNFSAYEVAQAFSHFSYVFSWEKRLICDIQGVHDAQTNQMRISDPAVHYYNRRKEYRKGVHGRADLGYTGIRRFFLTHECSELCKLVIHGLRTTSCLDRSEKEK